MWVIKARSKPPKPSRNVTQNKFGSQPNDPSTPSSQKTSTSHTKKKVHYGSGSSHQIIIKSRTLPFPPFFESGSPAVAGGWRRVVTAATSWLVHDAAALALTLALHILHSHSHLLPPRTKQAMDTTCRCSTVMVSLLNDPLKKQPSWRSMKKSIFYTQNNRDRTYLHNL